MPFERIFRESRDADYTTPQGRRALDLDLDRLYRLLLRGLGPEYLSEPLRVIIGRRSKGISIAPKRFVLGLVRAPQPTTQSVTIATRIRAHTFSRAPEFTTQSVSLGGVSG